MHCWVINNMNILKSHTSSFINIYNIIIHHFDIFNQTIIEGRLLNTSERMTDNSKIKNIFADIFPSIKLETTLPSSFNLTFEPSDKFKSKVDSLKLSKESKIFSNCSSKTVWIFLATDIHFFNSNLINSIKPNEYNGSGNSEESGTSKPNKMNQNLQYKMNLLEKIFGIYFYPDYRIDICKYQVIQLLDKKQLSHLFKHEQHFLPFKINQSHVILRY